MGVSRSTVHLLLLAAAACSARGDPNPELSQSRSSWAEEAGSYRYAPPPQPDDGWRPAPVEEVGLAREPLERMTGAIRRQEYANIHAVLIEKDGRLVYEEYFTGEDRRWRGDERATVSIVFHRDSLHDLRSVTRSVVSAFVHATVVDVRDGSLLPDRTVVVDGDRIRAVGPSGVVAVPEGAQVIDARGKYLIPGLWDMHTHLLWSTDEGEHSWVKMPRDLDSWTLWKRYYAPSLDLLIANGVTGIREMSGNLEIARRVQAEAEAAVRLAPRIIVAGHHVDGSPPIWPGALVATTPERGRALVDSLAAAGADFIKVYSHLAPEVYFAIAERARERGIPVAGHVPYRVPASAAAAGQSSFEHLIGVVQGCSSEEDRLITLSREQIEAAERGDRDRETELDRQWKVRVLATQTDDRCRTLLETLARNRTWQVPTLVLNRGLAYLNDPAFKADPRLEYMSPTWRDSWMPENDPYLLSTEEGYQLRRQHHALKLEITGLAAQAGVGIMAGTDTPNAFVFPGFALHDELALLVEAGLTPLQALQAATLNPARYLEATDSLGTIEAGKVADLVLLDANPLEDISNTRRISAVVLNGRYLDRRALDALLLRAKEKANQADR